MVITYLHGLIVSIYVILKFLGVAVAHPSYPRPIASKEQPKFVDIKYLEKVDNFNIIREKLLSVAEGKYILNDNNNTVSAWFLNIEHAN